MAEPGSPPRILQIYREPRRAGTRAAYDRNERQLARAAREFSFPHAYLGLEALDGAEEVWWLNGYDSEEEPQQVTNAYNQNAPLRAAFERLGANKAPLLLKPDNIFAWYREALSRGAPWAPGRGRFLTVTVTKDESPIEGAVFEAGDGTKFTFAPAKTRRQAAALAASAAPNARVFAVRPYWSKPTEDWVAADPQFWKS
jgi:hypothetical protein